MSSLLRKGIEGKCGTIDGLRPDYVETYDSDPEDLIVKTRNEDMLTRASRIFNVTQKSSISSYLDLNKKPEDDSPMNMKEESPMNLRHVLSNNIIEDHTEIQI